MMSMKRKNIKYIYVYNFSVSRANTQKYTFIQKKLYICVALCCTKRKNTVPRFGCRMSFFCCFYCCVASFFLLMVAHIILHRNSVYYLCMVLCCVVLCWVSLHHQPRRLCTFNEHKQIAICKRYRHTTQLYPPSIHARSVHSSV